QWPGTNYQRVDSLQHNDKVTILQRTDREEWLEVMTSRNRRGWVGSAHIIVIQGDLDDLPIWQPPSLPPVKTLTPDLFPPLLRERVSGWLSPHEQREYVFTETDEKVTIVLLFRPKIAGVKFSVLRSDQADEVGGGSGSASDQDGDLNTGELIWDSGSLIPDTYYHLRLINESEQRVEFCLARQNDYRWSCH
ncbi:MAG: SH3 domain-containing protein, partial [Chloroflexi bacterium]|nr:SH3 domain-containing protein [Chloroflexota bacterium]